MNELYHHGIRGQKWGVRNGPPYPIENKVMTKGTRLNSVSSYKNTKKYLNNDKIYTYNPNDKWDTEVYKGPFSYYLSTMRNPKVGAIIKRNGKVYDHNFVVTRDLKMPNSKERVSEFINTYNEYPNTYMKELDDYWWKMEYRGMPFRTKFPEYTAKNGFPQKLTSDYVDIEPLYEIFNHMMEHPDRSKITSNYLSKMMDKYDAMVDDNNVNIYNDAHDPVIVFNVKDTLDYVNKNGSKISMREIKSYVKDIENELKKEGKTLLY